MSSTNLKYYDVDGCVSYILNVTCGEELVIFLLFADGTNIFCVGKLELRDLLNRELAK